MLPIGLATGVADVRFQFIVGQIGAGGLADWQTSNVIHVQIF